MAKLKAKVKTDSAFSGVKDAIEVNGRILDENFGDGTIEFEAEEDAVRVITEMVGDDIENVTPLST